MNQRNKLEQPGAGLPTIERFFLNAGLKLGAVFLKPERALRMFLRDADAIIGMVSENDADVLSRVYLTPKLIGIEDSSRNWSVLMVIKHLCMANQSMLSIMRSLTSEKQAEEVISIADLKPPEDVDMLVVEDFRLLNQEIEVFVNQRETLRTDARHRHPWFGELDGHQWLCLAAAHQRIHRRQCRKILSMIGVV